MQNCVKLSDQCKHSYNVLNRLINVYVVCIYRKTDHKQSNHKKMQNAWFKATTKIKNGKTREEKVQMTWPCLYDNLIMVCFNYHYVCSMFHVECSIMWCCVRECENGVATCPLISPLQPLAKTDTDLSRHPIQNPFSLVSIQPCPPPVPLHLCKQFKWFARLSLTYACWYVQEATPVMP